MNSMLKEFKEFIASSNLLEIAVGLLLALKIKDVVDAFVERFFNPLIGAIFGKPNFDSLLEFTVNKGKANQSKVQIGATFTALLSLVITGFAMFMIVRAVNRMKAKNAGPAAPAGPTEVELLTEIRDSHRAR